jgi:hypothetical protein
MLEHIEPLTIVEFMWTRFLFMGEVTNMPHHALLMRLEGDKKFELYPYFVHIDDLRVVPEEEV